MLAILIGAVVAQIAIGATIDVVDRIPIVNKVLQLVGIAVSACEYTQWRAHGVHGVGTGLIGHHLQRS